MLAFALGRLRWTPDAVWRATPREIVAALDRPRPMTTPMQRDEMQALMRTFPDASASIT